MAARKPIVALIYDFDGTLAPGVMQERNFIPQLGLEGPKFWNSVKRHAEKHDMDEILAYMELMIDEATRKEVAIDRRSIAKYGSDLPLFPGVVAWFTRINAYGATAGVKIEHFVISSGLREMIAETPIAKYFKHVFASGFRYDHHDIARWPAVAVNYTTKTQYLFRINKGIPNCWDNSAINKYMEPSERPVPFTNMIYYGDGETDIPAMKMVVYQGGRAIAVYPPSKKGARELATSLVKLNRANAAAVADYSEGKPLERLTQSTIDEIAARHRFTLARGAK